MEQMNQNQIEDQKPRMTEEEWEAMMYDQFIAADGGEDAEFGRHYAH